MTVRDPIEAMGEILLRTYGNSLGNPPTRALIEALDEAGFAIVPKQLPESAMHAGNLDAEDSDQYEVLVEHCRVKP